MTTPAKDTRSTIISAYRYRDADRALAFLTEAFGFEEKAVYRDEAGKVEHAELAFGNGMIMLGPVRETEFGQHMRQPDEAGGVTASAYLIVADPDAHYARAKAAGAEILMEIADQDYGGRLYVCRDPEGQVWSFGSYDPW